MKRIFLATSLLSFIALAVGACGGAYTIPARGIEADIQASRNTSSASINRSDALNFRDSDLQSVPRR
jgi:hypothetical protein